MKKTYHISGMHCVSCETLLEKEFQELSEVQTVKASSAKATLTIESKKIIPEKKVVKILDKCGFTLSEKNNTLPNKKKKNLWEIISISLGLLILFFLISALEIEQYFPTLSENASLGVALLIGFIASISTCLALTGGIVMSFSSEYHLGKNASFLSRARPQIFFHLGRIGGFFLWKREIIFFERFSLL